MTEITFSAFPDAIIALAPDGRINFTNPAADQLLHKLDHGSALPGAVQAEVERVLKGGGDHLPTSFENALCVRIDEHEAFLLPRVIGMRDESGNIFGAAVVLQNVTRFRLLDDVKTNLVSTVSHELKTPLTSVRMGLHLLLEERIGSLNPKQTELLLAAREDSERLLRMINDLLDLAKLESGKAGLPPADNLRTGVGRERCARFARLCRGAGITAGDAGFPRTARCSCGCAADRACVFQLHLKRSQAHEGGRRSLAQG